MVLGNESRATPSQAAAAPPVGPAPPTQIGTAIHYFHIKKRADSVATSRQGFPFMFMGNNPSELEWGYLRFAATAAAALICLSAMGKITGKGGAVIHVMSHHAAEKQGFF